MLAEFSGICRIKVSTPPCFAEHLIGAQCSVCARLCPGSEPPSGRVQVACRQPRPSGHGLPSSVTWRAWPHVLRWPPVAAPPAVWPVLPLAACSLTNRQGRDPRTPEVLRWALPCVREAPNSQGRGLQHPECHSCGLAAGLWPSGPAETAGKCRYLVLHVPSATGAWPPQALDLERGV